MFISVCAILCGADDWNAIRLFAKTKEKWFRRYLTLPGGIPVAVTFNRVFAAIDPDLDFRVCTKRMFSQFSEKRKQLYANSFFKFGFISRFCLKAFVYAAFALPETD